MSATLETTMETPIGELRLYAEGDALVGIHLPGEGGAALPGSRTDPDHPVLARARAQLAEYFAGERTRFDLPLRARGTKFQERVWAALAGIRYGETRSYSEIATEVGQPTAVRAVGAANGHNPLPIVVPCHRVVGADGSLTGYGGGTHVKAWLLRHERTVLASRGEPLVLKSS
jgi:methylated-DNA-[protein]-cysteine S-methyltransferase